MPQFNVKDIHTLETEPTTPFNLRTKVDEVILNSTVVKAKVENMNPETGEYRIVLQGTLEQTPPKKAEK